jgi:hypothetical protein
MFGRGGRTPRNPAVDQRGPRLLQERRRARAEDSVLEVLQHADLAKIHRRPGRDSEVKGIERISQPPLFLNDNDGGVKIGYVIDHIIDRPRLLPSAAAQRPNSRSRPSKGRGCRGSRQRSFRFSNAYWRARETANLPQS